MSSRLPVRLDRRQHSHQLENPRSSRRTFDKNASSESNYPGRQSANANSMEGSDVDHVMRDANEEAANDEATAAAVDDPEAKEDEEEEDSDEEPWGKKKPIKPRLIQDVLIPFPKPDQMVKAEDRDHTILANMKWIHNAQRAQMRERHVAEIKQVQQDLQKSIDWDIITNLYPPTQEGFKQFVNPIVRQSLNSPGRFLKPTPLDVLPAAHRTVLVQKDQFERLRREKQQDPSSMDVDPEPKSELSVAELEFYLEDMMAHEIAKRKEEELDLYMLQEEEKHPIYRSIQKKMNSGRPALSRSVTSKDEPPRKLARRTSLPPLRTTENLVNKMQGVTLTALSAKTPVSTTSAIAEEGPHSAGATRAAGSRRHSMQERRSSAASIAESALLRVNDRRSPGRDMDVEAPQPPASPPKDLEQPEVHQTHKRKASIDAVQTDETAPVAKDRRLSREIRPENVPPWRRNSTAERPDTTSPRWSAAQSTNYNPWSAETSEWAQARRRSEENPISPRDRSRSPGRRASDDTRSRNYWDPEARSWNVWAHVIQQQAGLTTQSTTARTHLSHDETQILLKVSHGENRTTTTGIESSHPKAPIGNTAGQAEREALIGRTEDMTPTGDRSGQRPGGREGRIKPSEDGEVGEVVVKLVTGARISRHRQTPHNIISLAGFEVLDAGGQMAVRGECLGSLVLID
ncbi:hypothetical protein Dda_3903 [Drechslerella dactyloides]|uniref:Uncharacterized protein n=1 Tax=Drechslerella dactyloides TaxID=74499 RepID=A0AAD6NKC1_DREDA|nr:hypothetical protein Dda_3903 [Drechslerella dactyloides]